MAGLSDEQRLRAAVELSEGRPGDDAESIRRWGTQRSVVIRIVGTLAAMVAGAAIGLAYLSPRGVDRVRREIPSGQTALGTACAILGVILIIGTLIWMVRTGRFRSGWRSPAFALTWQQRRAVSRQIRGRGPVDDGALPVARAMARETVRQGPQLLLSLAGVLLVNFGNGLSSGSSFLYVMCAVVAVLLAVAVVAGQRDVRRARAFLAAHPISEPESDG